MRKMTNPPAEDVALRRKAEDTLAGSGEQPRAPDSQFNAHKVLHELQVHQVELEMQNEELRQTRDRLETALIKHTDLYEFSPASYFTLDSLGIILQTNFAGANLLRMDRSDVLGRDFGQFVSRPDKRDWADFFKQLLAAEAKMTREVSLETAQGRLYVLAEGVGNGSATECRLALLDITARKLAEEAVQRSRRHAMDILENTTDAFFETDRNFTVTYMNAKAEKPLFTTREKLLGKNFWEAFPEAVGSIFHREFQLALEQQKPVNFEAYYPPFGIWYECHAYPSPDSLSVYFRDITARKDLENSLRVSEQRYRDIVELQNELVCRYLADGRISFVNEAYLRYYDQKRELVLGTNFVPLIPKPDQDAIAAALKALTPDNPSVSLTHRIITPGGETRWQQWTHRALYSPGGEALEYQAVGSDITERKRSEELRDQIERIIRHDLRTPACNAINIARMLIDETNVTAHQRRLLNLFEHAGQNMIDTLDSSLDLYKIETGQYRREPQAFDCLSMVKEVIGTLAKKAQFVAGHGPAPVSCQPYEQDSRCTCLGEPKLLRTALQNLLVNAQEASPPGGEVFVKLSSDTDCRIEIRNQGAVPKEIRDRFFDKFVTKGKKKGTGIGTYSAKMMIEAQGGSIELDTAVKGQTTLTVRLPLPPPAVRPGRPEGKSVAVAPGLKILLVDDDKVARTYLTYMLEECGHQVRMAPDGARALSTLLEAQFDLVFMDVEMAVMDGLEATKRIRESGAAHARVPIIAMTAGTANEDQGKFLAAGMDGYIAKPMDLEGLRAVIERVLNNGSGN